MRERKNPTKGVRSRLLLGDNSPDQRHRDRLPPWWDTEGETDDED